MEPSGVWKNLLSGKQAVPTVACPSCGAQVPEFRIHSHLDTCLKVPEEEPAEAVHELSDGGEQSRRGRAVGARRGRGRGRKRREAGESKGRDGKRSKHSNVEGEKEVVEEEDDDEYASFYQRWEYSVAGLDELAKGRKEKSEAQERELLSSGVLTIERNEVGAMVSQLDRLLGEFQTAEEGFSLSSRGKSKSQTGSRFSQVRMPERLSGSSAISATADGNGQGGSRSSHGKAMEAWWEQWVTEEWPEGPLPPGFHAGLPPRPQSELRTGTEKAGMERSETAAIGGHHTSAINSILNLSESGGIIGGRSGVLPHSSEPLNKSSRSEVGMGSGSKTSTGEQSIPSGGMVHSSQSNPNVERSTAAECSAGRSGPSSSSTAPAKNPAEASGGSPGLRACPICGCPFAQEASNREINGHIDQPVVYAVLDGNGLSIRLTRRNFLERIYDMDMRFQTRAIILRRSMDAELYCLNCRSFKVEYKDMNNKKSDQPRCMRLDCESMFTWGSQAAHTEALREEAESGPGSASRSVQP